MKYRYWTELNFLAPNDHLLTSNRSHAYMKLGMYEESLEDAQRTIKTRPDWGKGHFRRGMVLQAQGILFNLFQIYVVQFIISDTALYEHQF